MNQSEAMLAGGLTEYQRPSSQPYGLGHVTLCWTLLEAITKDVKSILPPKVFNDPLAMIEFSYQFSQVDGLLKAVCFPEYHDGVKQSAYLEALTTIWIANFTRITKKRRLSIEKRQRMCQICILYYCFNLFAGLIPLKDEKYFEDKIEQNSSHNEWTSSSSPNIQKERFFFVFEILHYWGLEYWNPLNISGI